MTILNDASHFTNSLLAALNEPTLLVTFDGTIVAANRAVGELCGRSSATLLGARLADLLDDPPDEVARRLRDWSRSVSALPGALRFQNNGHSSRIRCDGSVLKPTGGNTEFLLIRCRTRSQTKSRFTALNEQVDRLTREVGARRTVELELRASEQRFRAAMEQAPLVTQIFSPEGDSIHANEAWERLWQADRSELQGYNVLKDPHLESLGAMPQIRRAFAGEPVEIPALCYDPAKIGKSGRPRWVEAYLYPVKGPGGDIREVVLMLRDVTERMKANEALDAEVKQRRAVEAQLAQANRELAHRASELEAIFNVLPVGVAVARDRDCTEIVVNRAAAALLGTSDANVSKSRPDADVLPFKVLRNGVELAPDELPIQFAAKNNVEISDLELQIVRADGKEITAFEYATPLHDENGEVRGAVGVFVDITDRKHSEEARAYLAAIVDSSDDAIISKSLDGTIKSWNKGAERIFGHTAEEAIGQSMRMLVPDDRQHEEDHILSHLARGDRIDHYETKRVRKDGRLIDVSLTVSAVPDSAGRIIGASQVARDITARKRAEAALRAKDNELKLIAETTPLILTRCSRELRFLFVNRAAASLFGLEQEEMVGRSIPETMGEATFAKVRPHIERVLRGEPVEYEEEIDYPHAGRRWVRANYIPERDADGTVAGWIASIVDITARKKAEEALRNSERRHSQVLDLMPAAVYACAAPHGEITFFNRQAAALWGRSPAIGDRDDVFCGAFRLWWPDGRQLKHSDSPMAIALREGREFRDQEVVIERPDGSRITVLVNIDPVKDQSGRIVGAINAFIDVTERKKAQEDLRLYREILRNASDGVAIIGPDGRYIEQNDAHRRLLGFDDGELAGKTPAIHLGEEAFAHIARGLAETGEWRGEVESRAKGGERLPLELAAFAVRDAQGAPICYVGLKRDIRERKRAEQHQQLLVAELSHRVKNTLATVLSIASQTAQRSGSMDSFRTAFEGRLQALAKAHGQLTRGHWTGASLRTLVREATEPHLGAASPERLVVSGHDLVVTPRAALLIAMVMHELATNAVKYGALSIPEGSVEVTWRIERENLVLTWRERGGPPVTVPESGGFGTSLLRRGVEFELDGETEIEYHAEGVICRITVPLKKVLVG